MTHWMDRDEDLIRDGLLRRIDQSENAPAVKFAGRVLPGIAEGTVAEWVSARLDYRRVGSELFHADESVRQFQIIVIIRVKQNTGLDRMRVLRALVLSILGEMATEGLFEADFETVAPFDAVTSVVGFDAYGISVGVTTDL